MHSSVLDGTPAYTGNFKVRCLRERIRVQESCMSDCASLWTLQGSKGVLRSLSSMRTTAARHAA